MKRFIPLLVLTLTLAAPVAMADHCERCRPATLSCGPASNFGFENCEWTFDNQCITSSPCGDHSASLAAAQPLASEFTVALVERLDEAPSVSEARVASLETATPTDR